MRWCRVARQIVGEGKPYNQRPAIVWGQEVIVRERALAPHPHPHHNGRLVETRGVTKLLLVDGRELFECDICGWLNENVRSVVGHLPKHNPAQREPDYPEATIRYVLRLATVEREKGIRDYATRVSNFLNTEGKVTPFKSEAWTPAIISAVWNRYHDKYRIHVRRNTQAIKTEKERAKPVTTTPPTPVTPTTVAASINRGATAAGNDLDNILTRLAQDTVQARRNLEQLETDMTALVREVDQLRRRATAPVDPTILAKAKKYDEVMKNMMLVD
jgi:hypothetical protein